MVSPGQLDQLTQRLEALRDGLAAQAGTITAVMRQYAHQGGDVPGLALMLGQAQARSVTDAADMRARSQLAYRLENAPANIAAFQGQGSLDGGAMLSMPWDSNAVGQQAAKADAQDLRDALDSTDPVARAVAIAQVEQDIKDHLAEGQDGLAYLSAFFSQASPAVASLASVLYSQDGTLRQPFTVKDQQTLNTFASGLAYVLRYGTGAFALTPQGMDALTKAPDMWSVAMLVRYGPGAEAYGTTGQGAQLLKAVSQATVQISPHVIVSVNDSAVLELRAAWAWASTRHVSLATSAGDVEYTRWVEIAAVSPYRGLFIGQLYREFASISRDYRIEGAFNQDEKVLVTTAGMGAAVFFGDPRSLLGATPEEVRKLIPPDFTGPLSLKSGRPGWRYFDAKGRSIIYEESDPSADLGQPDSLLHQGPYYRMTENGYVYRIAAAGDPALNDSNAASISITMPDKTKTYIYENMPVDEPGDGDGGDLGAGEGGAGAVGDAGAAVGE